MSDPLYARLREDVNIRLRRGAWYRVLKVEGLKAILEVNGRNVLVAAPLLEIVNRPPPALDGRHTGAGQRSQSPARTGRALWGMPELRRARAAAQAGPPPAMCLLQI